MNPQKELLWGLWVSPNLKARACPGTRSSAGTGGGTCRETAGRAEIWVGLGVNGLGFRFRVEGWEGWFRISGVWGVGRGRHAIPVDVHMRIVDCRS